MAQGREDWKDKRLLGVLFLLGLAFEAGIQVVGAWWARKYSIEWTSMGPVLFGLSAVYLYLGSVLLTVLFSVDQVGASTMVLLSGMLAWLVAVVLVLMASFFVALALYGIIAVPVRLLASLPRRLKGANHGTQRVSAQTS